MTAFISKHRQELRRILAGLLGPAAVLALWSGLARYYHPMILPSPGETWRALVTLWREDSLLGSVAITLRRTVWGYALALLAGFSLAALTKGTAFWRALLRPILAIVQIIPPVVWTILAVIWFGVASQSAPIFLIFMVTLPLSFANTAASLDSIDGRLVEMAQVYRCSRRQIVTQLYLPALLPQLANTVSVGFSFAWKAAIFAEFMGSTSGVGFLLSTANSNLETEKVFAWVLVLIAVMLVCEYGLLLPLKRRAERWWA